MPAGQAVELPMLPALLGALGNLKLLQAHNRRGTWGQMVLNSYQCPLQASNVVPSSQLAFHPFFCRCAVGGPASHL